MPRPGRERLSRSSLAVCLACLSSDKTDERCSSKGNSPRAGHFSGVAHVATVLDHTPRRPLRHALLRLLHSLMVPEAALRGDDAAAAAAARSNGTVFMACGGVELIVDLLTCARLLHDSMCSARQRIPREGSDMSRT